MRRSASVGAVAFVVVSIFLAQYPASADDCEFDPGLGRIVCHSGGSLPPGDDPTLPPGDPGDDPGLQYVHTAIDPVIGPCHFWSNVPGGLDAWDPANDAAVIAITTTLPICPNPTVDPENRAWEVFRSWDLAVPDPTVTPPDRGITGLPTYLAAPEPAAILHDEVLPDGRPLSVRARVTAIEVVWGDGAETSARPDEAAPHPDGSVHHVYALKTCSAEYRTSHPSGGLCHPTLDRYVISVTWVWTGEFDSGAGWTTLGTLVRTTQLLYDVDELRGVNVP